MVKITSLLFLLVSTATGNIHNAKIDTPTSKNNLGSSKRRNRKTDFPWGTKTDRDDSSIHANDMIPSVLYSESSPIAPSQNLAKRTQLLERVRLSLEGVHRQYTELVSVKVKPRPEIKAKPSVSNKVSGAFVAEEVWPILTGKEFNEYENVSKLSETAMKLCGEATHPDLEWKPDKQTEKILKEHGENGSTSLTHALRNILPPDTILVWTAKFNPITKAYGAQLPIIRTRGIVSNMSPRSISSLLMDSSQVQTYNKMSLGREDDVIFQHGIDTEEGYFGDGESKIVVNLTKPPLVKKLMEFRTMMHARKLRPNECIGEEGYVIVSRAVPGSSGDDDEEHIRSEILMGANLLRSVPSQSESTDLTSVTHVNSPLVHPMVAGKVGMKGAIDFFNDMRALGKK